MGNNTYSPGSELRFREILANGPSYVGFKGPSSLAASVIWTLPAADAAGIWSSDGANTLTVSVTLSLGEGLPSETIGNFFSAGSTAGTWYGRIGAGGAVAKVAMGQRNGEAWIVGHNNALNTYTNLHLQPDGAFDLIVGAGSTGTWTGKMGVGIAVPTVMFDVGGAIGSTSSIKSRSDTAGIGYATGAGEAAVQATSKSTTVTNTASAPSACGTITMDAANLVAATIVSFTFTNAAIAATDVLILNHISGGTIGAYTFNAQAGAGSAIISVRNATAGDLAEAVVIQYALIKGVVS